MDKNEILEKSRRDNKNRDIVEIETLKQGGKVATYVGMLLCCILSVIQIIFRGKLNSSLWVIYFAMMGSREIVKSIKLREKISSFMCIFYFALSVFFVVVYLFDLIGK